MIGDDVEALRKELARHTGPARMRPSVDLARGLTYRCWRVGIGSPEARPYLDEAIQMLEEAYGYLTPGEFARGRVAGQLGSLIGTRYIVDWSPQHDRERGIVVIEEALAFPQLPSAVRTLNRAFLGVLLINRLLASMQSSDVLIRMLFSGPSSKERANLDRAIECMQQVLDDPAASREITSITKTMLGMAEVVKTMADGTGGGPMGLVKKVSEMQALMQRVQQEAAERSRGTGFGYLANPFDFEADSLATADSLERIVFVFNGTAPAEPTPATVRLTAQQPIPAAMYREAFWEKLPEPGFAGAIDVLDKGATSPSVDTVDDLVALGSSLVEAPDAVGTDRVLFAVALFLRAIGQGDGGWGADDGGADDAQVAADSLLTAGDAVLKEPADAMVLAFRLAFRLDSYRSGLDTQSRLAERFATVTEALRKVRADGLLYSTREYLLLLSAATGRFAFAAPGSPLPARLLVVAEDPLPDPTIVSYVGSAAQLVELAKRTRRPLGEQVVFVSNPRRDRPQATVDALMLRRTFYPGSTGLGETIEDTHGAGTAVELRKNLGASLLQLGCGITADGGLELADSDVLEAADIAAGSPAAAGGLAILPPTAKGVADLTEALLASRFVGVIAFRNEVPERLASLMFYLLHTYLVHEKLDPAAAVAAVRRWMADPDRHPVPDLPGLYEGAATTAEFADPAYRGALVHHGVSRPRRPTGVSRDRPRPA